MKKFLSPLKLGITLQEFGELLATHYLLKSKSVRYNPRPTNDHGYSAHKPMLPDMVFNMGHAAKKADCGTVGCIGGHMQFVRGVDDSHDIYRYVETHRSSPLQPLFFPNKDGVSNDYWPYITPAHAVKAIENFLTTGKPKWKKVVNVDTLRKKYQKDEAKGFN